MQFTDRASYKTAVAIWKQQYAKLSADIRQAKVSKRLSERAVDTYVSDQAIPEGERTKVWLRTLNERYAARNLRWELAYTARTMLEERAAGKVEAQRQYLEQQEQARMKAA